VEYFIVQNNAETLQKSRYVFPLIGKQTLKPQPASMRGYKIGSHFCCGRHFSKEIVQQRQFANLFFEMVSIATKNEYKATYD